MKKIGLIGGLSWVSTAEYYRRINEISQEKIPGINQVQLVLEQVNRCAFIAAVERQDHITACQIILDAAKVVERGGAEFIVITCNSAHRFVNEVQPQISIPFLHIAEATAKEIKAENIETIALTGVLETMNGTFYREILKHHGIETIIPNEEEMTFIDETVMNELVKGIFKQSTRESYAKIFSDLTSRGAEGVIMGCTEIPLLLSDDDVDVKIFSTTEIHCQAAVELAIE